MNVFDSMIQKCLNQSSGFGESITQQEKMRHVFLASNVMEEFVLEFAWYHLNCTASHMRLKGEHIGEYVKDII